MNAHRLVNEALKDVIAGIHGLQVSQTILTPDFLCLTPDHLHAVANKTSRELREEHTHLFCILLAMQKSKASPIKYIQSKRNE